MVGVDAFYTPEAMVSYIPLDSDGILLIDGFGSIVLYASVPFWLQRVIRVSLTLLNDASTKIH